jgi:hypothetical protein
MDARTEELTSIIPGFAGYAYSDDPTVLVVHLKDMSFADSARRVATQEFAGREMQTQYGSPQITAKKVKYSYVELAAWARSIAEKEMPGFGLSSLGLDPVRNRVDVNFRDSPSVADIRAFMRKARIPDDAYFAQVGVNVILDSLK